MLLITNIICVSFSLQSGILGGKNPGGLAPVDDKECIYADCDEDYKDIYEFGPVAYHHASREAAAKKKESLECSRFKAATTAADNSNNAA